MAFVGTICSSTQSGGINVFQKGGNLPYISTVVAHEMGHNLGMNHDSGRCDCGGSCIMAATAGNAMCGKIQCTNLDANKPPPGGQIAVEIIDGMSCVNADFNLGTDVIDPAYVNPGSPCGKGQATTCRFAASATCADGLCCSGCQIKVAGTPCRESVNPCDLPEYCVGNSGFCPEDFYVMDGLTCENSSAYCYEGRCQTYDYQCKTIFAPGAKKADDKCFLHANVKGDKNAMCGKIQCTNLDANKPPPGGQIAVEIIDGMSCVNADFNLGTDVIDPAYVNPGSPCGKGQTCLDFNCVNASALVPNLDCDAQTTCNGRGICNDQGNCHCDNGWAPPNCDTSGRGGNYSLRNGLLIFFLLVVPVIILVTVLVLYFCRRDSLTSCVKRKRSNNNGHQSQSHQYLRALGLGTENWITGVTILRRSLRRFLRRSLRLFLRPCTSQLPSRFLDQHRDRALGSLDPSYPTNHQLDPTGV
ncbi:hypothetical protein CRUP_002868 [Coryphaenoides rupestris]|nr:hypothetical protein CRUP_002868 [Coryphaenoides rupestris]